MFESVEYQKTKRGRSEGNECRLKSRDGEDRRSLWLDAKGRGERKTDKDRAGDKQGMEGQTCVGIFILQERWCAAAQTKRNTEGNLARQ